MKKFFMVVALATSIIMGSNIEASAQTSHTRTGNKIEFAAEKKQGPVRKTTIEPEDKKTGLTMDFGGKTYEIYLNKNNKAFILAQKKDGTGTYIKWLGAEKTAIVLNEMKK